MRLFLVVFVLCAALCMTSSLVHAEGAVSSFGTSPIEEYDNIPKGVLLPGVYTLLKKKGNMSSSNALFLEGTEAMTLEEVIKAYHEKRYDVAAKYLLPLAESGSHQVEEILGIMYLNGQGVPKNSKDAYFWFLKAAKAGRPLAEHDIAILTFKGEGVPPSRRGDVRADPARALMWLNIAILHYPTGPEKTQAMLDRDSISARLTRRDRDRALELTRDWLYEKGEKLLFDLEMEQ